jgi:hypothetical protein
MKIKNGGKKAPGKQNSGRVNNDGFVKSRHSRVGGNPESMELIEITGFPFSRE